MTDNNNTRFYALIVLYNPKDSLFIENVRKLLLNDVSVIIYDNSTSFETIEKNNFAIKSISSEILFFHNNALNMGLSYAFNDAITRLGDLRDEDGLFLFDQDSQINIKSIKFLIESFLILLNNSDFGMLAGMPIRKDGNPYRMRPTDNYVSNNSNLVEVYQIPSSYSVIPIGTFRKVGNFEQDFFIDQIDNNFSLRCYKSGLKIFIDKRATFVHDIGLGDVKIFNKFLFPYSTPDRHYYQTRNLILSYKRYKVGNFKLFKKVFLRVIIVIYIGLVKGHFFSRIKFAIRGIKDGLHNIGGKIS